MKLSNGFFCTYIQNYQVIFSLRLFQINIVYFLDIDSENVERSAEMDSRLYRVPFIRLGTNK